MAVTRGTGLDSPPLPGRTAAADPPAGIPAGVGGNDGALGAGRPGPFARLGAWAASHFRRVLIGWVLVVLVFGIFAVHVENALAGAGWQASNSQSVAARAIIEKDFSGLGATALQVVIVDHHGPIASDSKAQTAVVKATNVLRSDPRVSTVVPPQAGVSLSRDGRTAIITAGSAANSNQMVQAADSVQPKLAALSSSGVTVTLTGDSALWANFNTANRSAMLRSEMLSWPVTIVILVIAFGSLVAAGLPLLLTMAGLLVAAGALVITTKFMPVSIWALNFALMFALALGIDYALFLVMRFRAALKRRDAKPGDREAIVASVAETVDTAGKAVAFSALTVLASLAAIMIVPSPAFRSMAFGIMLSVVAVLAATLTLLPAVLGKLGTNINKGTIRLRRGPRPEGEGIARPGPAPLGQLLVASSFPGRCRSAGPAPLGRRADHRDADQHALDHDRARQCQRPNRLRPGDQCLRPGCSRHPPGGGPPRRTGPRPFHPRPRVRRGGCRAGTDQGRMDPRPGGPEHRALDDRHRRDHRPPPPACCRPGR